MDVSRKPSYFFDYLFWPTFLCVPSIRSDAFRHIIVILFDMPMSCALYVPVRSGRYPRHFQLHLI